MRAGVPYLLSVVIVGATMMAARWLIAIEAGPRSGFCSTTRSSATVSRRRKRARFLAANVLRWECAARSIVPTPFARPVAARDLYWSSEEIDPHLRDIIPRDLTGSCAGLPVMVFSRGHSCSLTRAQARYRPGRAGRHDLLNIRS